MIINGVGIKCHRCQKFKDLEAFAISRQTKRGRQSYCRECQKGRLIAWRKSRQEAAAKKPRQYCTWCGCIIYFQMERGLCDRALCMTLREKMHKEYKLCSKCRIRKPIDAFYPKASYRGGRDNQCRACVVTYQREANRKRRAKDAGQDL